MLDCKKYTSLNIARSISQAVLCASNQARKVQHLLKCKYWLVSRVTVGIQSLSCLLSPRSGQYRPVPCVPLSEFWKMY